MANSNNEELYKAVMYKEHDRVLRHCKEIPEGPFRVLTIHDDTVLHMALYSLQVKLVTSLLDLLKEFPQDQLEQKMLLQNNTGNTILHEAAICDEFVPAAKEMLHKTPELLIKTNKFADTALFRAVRYGQVKMFQFLDKEVNKSKFIRAADRKSFYHSKRSNILHTAIITEQFGMALLIAKKYPRLVNERDEEGLTALQHLARNPAAFNEGSGWQKRYILSGVSTEDNTSVREEGKE
ncbi:unnamed protein product [Ilex paraguariensis]|uniref:Uncharacterized protein n=1 Tax=Ilex paraguariensis TaxID=185542 RepID=A0ABC8S3E3_9AQUA